MSEQYSTLITRRYVDAFRTARIINGIGTILKAVGFLIGALLCIGGGYALYQRNDYPALYINIGIIVLGIVSWLSLFFIGMVVSALGQILKANLDMAVNTSPFLSDDQRATTMSLTRH